LKNWRIKIKTCDFNKYIILDDDSDMLYWQRNNFICIDGGPGLTENVAYKAIRMLNSMKNLEG